MAKIVGYYSPGHGLGAGLLDMLGAGGIDAAAKSAALAALPIIEEKINEKLVIAGIAAAVGFAGLGLLIWTTRPR